MHPSKGNETGGISLEFISNMSKDQQLNFAIYKITNEDNLSAQTLKMRIKNLEALMVDILDKEESEDPNNSYYKLVRDWEKEINDVSKEERNEKRLEVEYRKYQELMRRLNKRVPVESAAIMATVKEINKINREEYKEYAKQREQEERKTEEDEEAQEVV